MKLCTTLQAAALPCQPKIKQRAPAAGDRAAFKVACAQCCVCKPCWLTAEGLLLLNLRHHPAGQLWRVFPGTHAYTQPPTLLQARNNPSFRVSRHTSAVRCQPVIWPAPHQRRYLGTKMAARMISSGSSTCSSFSKGLPPALACFAFTALMADLLVSVTSPPCTHAMHPLSPADLQACMQGGGSSMQRTS